MKQSARVWKVGDNVNTDLILPILAFYLSPEEQARYVFHANRPGWVDEVRPGDILIAGRNFGMGSSRPAARSLKTLGIGCLIAHSINGLFFRNAVNWALPALECPGVHEAFEEGDVAEVDLETSQVRNRRSGQVLVGQLIPAPLLAIVKAGGIYELLEKEGAIGPPPVAKKMSVPIKVVGSGD